MKKVLSIFLILALVFTTIPLATHADTAEDRVDANGFAYRIEGDTAIITRYDKEVPNHFVIPSTEEGKPVTAIADGFSYYLNNSANSTLELPSTITYIGSRAFDSCGFVGTLTLPSGLKTIGVSAFAVNGFTGDLVIPETVTSLGANAFDGCTSFNGRLTLPSGLTKIKDATFWRCGFTGSLTIPPNVETIGYSAFEECVGFTGELIIPSKVTSIGAYAFDGCTGFTGDLTIPSSVRTIYNHAFYNCTGFSGKLTILPGVTFIGRSAFARSPGFTGSIVIPPTVKTINAGAFAYDTGFTGTVVVPASVESMHFYVFPLGIKVEMASKKTFLHDDNTALATPSPTKLFLDGKAIAVDTYSVDTVDYFKLADIATAFNSTDKKFNFIWNAKKNTIKLEVYKPYKASSSKNTKSDGKAKKAKLKVLKLFVYDTSEHASTYIIDGNIYCELRDIMPNLAVSVDYDEETQTVLLKNMDSEQK